MDSQRLLNPANADNEHDSSEGEDWSEGSSYSSYSSDSDSTIPDWEPYVDDFSGGLLYIECHPFVVQNNKELKNKEPVDHFTRGQLRRSSRGKFLKLIRRRDSKRKSKKAQKSIEINEVSTSKVKFQDSQEGEEKEVMLEIDAENRHNLSSDKSLAESLLGLIVSTLSDGNRVMIAGFSFDSKAKNERNIKIGDWLKSINNIPVNVRNLDDILQKFINRDDVLLKLQRVAGVEVTKDPPINELNNESDFVKDLLNPHSENDKSLMEIFRKHPLGVIFINIEKLTENSNDNEDIVYVYPRPVQKNILAVSKGMYITLNDLINEITKSHPQITSIKFKDEVAYVTYKSYDNQLFLLMLPGMMVTRDEMTLISNEIIRLLKFMFGTIGDCFGNEKNHAQLDHFFSRFFVRILNHGLWITIQQFINSELLSIEDVSYKKNHFEDILSVARMLTLPDEAQMQIDDALTELEASDYRDWNEEPLDCQRLFTILGSALFHSGYLLATHFIHVDLMDVHTFCKQQGLFYLSRNEPIKSLVMWKEVFPSSTIDKSLKIPDGKRYLLIVGCAKDLLAVIMEAGGCTEPAEENMGPDAFYVEEAQATLAHIQELGLSELAERILSMDSSSQIVMPVPQVNKKRSDFISLSFSKSSAGALKDFSNSPKKNEVTSILKRRSSDQNFIHYNSNTSLQEDSFDGQSEGSGSQGGYSERSEISDDSRRNFRKMKYDSNDEEDSETNDYVEESQISVSSFDVSEIRQTLLSETEDFKLLQLTAGHRNILIHYCHLDITQGILLVPADSKCCSQSYEIIVDNFRRCSLQIHSLFENTLRFKNMPTQEIAKSVMNKSLVAIKEHGVLFECPYVDEKEKKNKIVYWVVGRLFYMPHPQEMYLCYQDGIPQNLIEIAFKLKMNSG